MTSGTTGIQFVLFFAGFFLGATLWCIAIAIGIHWGRRWMRPAVFRWINALCGLALGYFGIRVLWIALQEWLGHQLEAGGLIPLHSIAPLRHYEGLRTKP